MYFTISLFSSVRFCLRHFATLLLDARAFRMIMSSWLMVLLSLKCHEISSLVCGSNFCLLHLKRQSHASFLMLPICRVYLLPCCPLVYNTFSLLYFPVLATLMIFSLLLVLGSLMMISLSGFHFLPCFGFVIDVLRYVH